MMIRARLTGKRNLASIVLALLVVVGAAGGAGARGLADGGARALAAGEGVQLFDANIRYTSGLFVPLATDQPSAVRALTTDAWTRAARPVSRVAADGVTLVLVRAQLPLAAGAPITFSLTSAVPGADPGSLWAIDDQGVIDDSAEGGAIDGPSGPARTTLTVVQKRGPFVLFIYRAPRNFDSPSGLTGDLASRTAWLSVQPAGSPVPLTQAITIARPLVVFVHGTSANNDAWAQFPLWQNSANELNGFQPGTLPFQATRISFHWIWNSTGAVQDNAETILPQLVTALRDWREATATAATQANVVTHSFGGFVARQVTQTQPDPDPLAMDALHNFRAAANWGHGLIHQLVTLAATHRGSGDSNTVAFLNANGNIPGDVRKRACMAGNYIDQGALRDQMVLSPALQSLRETRVPGHAVVGSGRAALDPSNFYNTVAFGIYLADKQGGNYKSAFEFNNGACPTDTLANYLFNLAPNTPPVTGSSDNMDCSVTPNYDLVVSAYSSQGLMPAGATTTALDLDPAGGLIGRLNHSALHDPSFGSAQIVKTISDRVAFLLKQATTSPHFSYFPAVDSTAPTPLEARFSQEFDPVWLQAGNSCPAPSYDSSCPVYDSVQIVPSQLLLQDATPTPLYAYGYSKGEWLLAYAPTSSSSTSRNCTVTLVSSDPGVVDFATNPVTGAQTAVATGAGSATIHITVKNFAGSIAPVPVTVTGVGN